MTTGHPGQPMLRRALRASTSFVLALTRCGRCTLTPAAAPALTGTYPGSQHNHRPQVPQPDPRNRQASPEAKPIR